MNILPGGEYLEPLGFSSKAMHRKTGSGGYFGMPNSFGAWQSKKLEPRADFITFEDLQDLQSPAFGRD